jgi:cytochrome c oxidase subunit 4
VTKPALYVCVWAALLALLGLTLLVAALPLGALGLVLALAIACAKAGLIAHTFMHLREESTLVRAVAGLALVWLAILFGLTLSDTLTRGAF